MMNDDEAKEQVQKLLDEVGQTKSARHFGEGAASFYIGAAEKLLGEDVKEKVATSVALELARAFIHNVFQAAVARDIWGGHKEEDKDDGSTG